MSSKATQLNAPSPDHIVEDDGQVGNSTHIIEANDQGGSHLAPPADLAVMAAGGGGSVVVADRRAANAQNRELGQMTLIEAAKWASKPEHIEETLQTCLKLQRSAKGAYQRTGVRLYLQTTRILRELLTELRLQQEAQPNAMAVAGGVTISQATRLIQETVVKSTAVAPPSVDHTA